MALEVRRVVTGHDAEGRAVVLSDEVLQPPEGGRGIVFWTSEGFPVDNDGDTDEGRRQVGVTLPNGTVFREIEFAPANPPRRHRTESVDYALILSGEIDMEFDDSDHVVHFKAGDVLVQRGTMHNWVNRGTVPCRIAFILVSAKPVHAGGKILGHTGI